MYYSSMCLLPPTGQTLLSDYHLPYPSTVSHHFTNLYTQDQILMQFILRLLLSPDTGSNSDHSSHLVQLQYSGVLRI